MLFLEYKLWYSGHMGIFGGTIRRMAVREQLPVFFPVISLKMQSTKT